VFAFSESTQLALPPRCPPEPVLSLTKGGHDGIPAKAGI
jgi:hypothetical protein